MQVSKFEVLIFSLVKLILILHMMMQSVAEPPPPPAAVAGTGSKSGNTGVVVGIAVGAAVVGLGQPCSFEQNIMQGSCRRNHLGARLLMHFACLS